ncbi:MAG: hypothetical protein ACRC2K_04195 [Clostridium sp.]
MKAKNFVCILFPSLIMGIVSFIAFSNIFDVRDVDLKGLFIFNLIVIFPLLYLLQGVVAFLTKTNPFVAFSTSTVGYLIIMFIYMNSSAIGYILFFGLFYSFGYFVSRFFSNIKLKF